MALEDVFEAFGVLELPADRFIIFCGGDVRGLAPGVFDAAAVLFEVFLVGEDGKHVAGRGEDAADDGFAEGHLRGNAAVKKLGRHITLTVQIADICRGKTKERDMRIMAE